MPDTVQLLMAQANAAVPRLSSHEAAEKLQQGALALDVRDSEEVQKTGKIAGAAHISRGLLEFRADPSSPAHHPDLDPNRTILVYCASGGRSALAGKTLKDMGFTSVFNIGGFAELARGGLPVESA